MTSSFIIAVAGASGSGKSTLAENLSSALTAKDKPNKIIREDHYYRAQDHVPLEQREKQNYDHPNAFEHDLLAKHLHDLKQGKSIDYPDYCYKTHTRKAETESLEPTPIIILEGIMILTIKPLLSFYDVKLFVDTPLDICLLRRLNRDVKERGRSLESVSLQYESTVKPMYHQFIEPSRSEADLLIPEGGENSIALQSMQSLVMASTSQ